MPESIETILLEDEMVWFLLSPLLIVAPYSRPLDVALGDIWSKNKSSEKQVSLKEVNLAHKI